MLAQTENLDLVSYRDQYNDQSWLHYCVFNGHADLVEKLLQKDHGLVNCVDDDKNTPFHTLCKNSVSSKEDLIHMYQKLKDYGWDRKTANKYNKTGLDILKQRIKNDNPYDCSLPVTSNFYEFLEPSKRTSLQTTKSCPQGGPKRFSGLTILNNQN